MSSGLEAAAHWAQIITAVPLIVAGAVHIVRCLRRVRITIVPPHNEERKPP